MNPTLETALIAIAAVGFALFVGYCVFIGLNCIAEKSLFPNGPPE